MSNKTTNLCLLHQDIQLTSYGAIGFFLTTGGRINSHVGNVRFREIIHRHKKEYLSPTTKKLEKAHIAKRIVDYIRNMNPSGRFLKEDASDGFWYDIGDAKALKKVRPKLDGGAQCL